jgi:pantetheine-phosphate adenylyltransferase
MQTALYPGSFDPVTNGHLDIIIRASRLMSKLYVAVLQNSAKNSTFSDSERVALLKQVVAARVEDEPSLANVEVVTFGGLVVDFAEKIGAGVLIRGLRVVSDFEYEFQMALTNRQMLPQLETLLSPASLPVLYLSSSIVKEIARYGGDISEMVPAEIRENIISKLRL